MTIPQHTPPDLEALIMNHQGLIRKVAFTYADNREDRNDLAQEIVYQICRSYRSFKEASSVSTWLYRIAINTALGSLRKKRPATQALQEQDAIQDESDETESRTRSLQEAIKLLSDSDRTLVLLYLDELPYKEIGAILGLSENSVAVKMHRTKQKLKTLIDG